MLLLVVGKTCSGKDTVAHYLEDKYGLKRIVTYTTRQMRSDDEQGVSHHFISQRQADGFDPDDVFSPTTIDGHLYFTSKAELTDMDSVYICDPKGVVDVAEAGIQAHTLYVDCPEPIIFERAVARGTDPAVVMSRLESERERFERFYESNGYTFYINNSKSVDVLKGCVDTCMISLVNMHEHLDSE